MKYAIIGASLVLSLSSCVTQEQVATAYATQTPAKPSTRKRVVEYAKTTFFDPYSMRDVSVSDELRGTKPGVFMVCVRANAKNRMGAYTGLSSTGLRLTDGGSVEATWPNDPACNDPRLRWSPFPELEAL